MPDEEKGVTSEAQTEETPSSDNLDSQPEAEAEAKPSGGDTPAGKTYSEEELQNIIHERTRKMSADLQELQAYRSLGAPGEISKKLRPPEPAGKEPVLSDEDKQFREYLYKHYPAAKFLNDPKKFEKLMSIADNWDKHEPSFNYMDNMRAKGMYEEKAFIDSSRAELQGMCKEAGISDKKAMVIVENTVAEIIKADPSMYAKFMARDKSYLKDAFTAMQNTVFGGIKRNAVSDVAKIKQKMGGIGKPLPSGGSPIPVKPGKKMTDDERTEAAFNTLIGGGSSEIE